MPPICYRTPPKVLSRILLATVFLPVGRAAAQATQPSRTVRFTYAATLVGLVPGQSVRVWVPVAHTTLEQQVTLQQCNLPGNVQFTQDARFHNHIAYAEAPAATDGTLLLSVVYQVTRHAAGPEPSGESNDPLQPSAYLQPDRLVPAGGHTATLLAGMSIPGDPTLLARLLFNVVDDTLAYRKDQPGWGRGDAVWACDSKFGNCTDFTSLFISLARGQHLPAKYEMGFPLPPVRGHGAVNTYHCWAWFLDAQNRWTPVDLSHAKQNPAMREYLFGHLDADRIAFTIGRDITLVPPQAGPPLNYFVYPYAEVNGQPVSSSQIHGTFTYDDAR